MHSGVGGGETDAEEEEQDEEDVEDGEEGGAEGVDDLLERLDPAEEPEGLAGQRVYIYIIFLIDWTRPKSLGILLCYRTSSFRLQADCPLAGSGSALPGARPGAPRGGRACAGAASQRRGCGGA